MPAKIPLELGPIQRTLLLPLWGRAAESRKAKPLLVDHSAMELVRKIDYDFAALAAGLNPASQFGWIARSIQSDRIIRRFLEQYPNGAVVNLGCGLDTTLDRVDNGSLYWYDLDLPDVIALRRELLPERPRVRLIAGSFLDETWWNEIRPANGVLFVAAGLLYYFDPDTIRAFLRRLAARFLGAELIFDGCSPLGLKLAKRMVLRDGGMDDSLVLKWGFQNARSLEDWDPRLQLVEQFSVFRKVGQDLSVRTRLRIAISGLLKIMFMVHLRFLEKGTD